MLHGEGNSLKNTQEKLLHNPVVAYYTSPQLTSGLIIKRRKNKRRGSPLHSSSEAEYTPPQPGCGMLVNDDIVFDYGL